MVVAFTKELWYALGKCLIGNISYVTVREICLVKRKRENDNLVDPASSHTLVSKIKPCMSKYKHLYCETANGSLYQS